MPLPTNLSVPSRRTQRLGRRLTDRSVEPLHNSTIAFVLMTLVLLGVVGIQAASLRDFKRVVYDRCVDLKPGSDDAHDFRTAQVRVFRLLAADPSIPENRQQFYTDLVAEGEQSLATYSSPDCAKP